MHFFPLNGGISLLMVFYPSWQSIKSVALVTEKWFLHAIDPYFLLHFWQQHCMFWYHYLHVFCFKTENKGVCLLLFGTPECGSRVSLGEYVPYYRLCPLRFPPKSFRDSTHTSVATYVATETESNGAKIDGLLPPNFM